MQTAIEVMVATKVCRTCHIPYPLYLFGKHKTGKFGLLAHCRVCWHSKISARYRNNPNIRKARDRRRVERLNARLDDEIGQTQLRLHPNGTKRCSSCQDILSLALFSLSRERDDGLCHQCKRCVRGFRRERLKNLDNAGVARRRAQAKSYYWSDLNSQRKRQREQHRMSSNPGAAKVGFEEKLRATGGLCVYCRTNEATEQDHMIPTSRGGEHEPLNVAPTCSTCNITKGNKTPLEFIVYQIEMGIRTW